MTDEPKRDSSPLDLERLRELCEKATPGPWYWVNPDDDGAVLDWQMPISLRTVEERDNRWRYTLPAWILDVEEAGGG